MSLFRGNKLAFTLIEISVSLFIIIIVVSLAVANYNTGYSGINLVSGQQSLFQNMKLAQSYALSYRSYNDALPAYWGIYLATSSSNFYFFADVNGNGVYDEGEADPFLGGRDIYLSVDTEISGFNPVTSAISVLFESGTGRMFVYDIGASAFDNNPWAIELKDKRVDLARLIVVEPPTNIDMQNCSCSDASLFCCSFCSAGDSCTIF